MPRLSQEKIDQIRQSVDIVDVIGQYISIEKSGRNYKAVCPFHDDSHPSLSISINVLFVELVGMSLPFYKII